MNKTLYIIAYDITDPKRLNSVRYFLKQYSTGGQKSVYECFLTDGQLKYVESNLRRLIFEPFDRVHIFQLDGRSRTHTLGRAIQPKNPEFFYIG
ncbi:MAG: CRISPR-associated endonuclease Cas2 [Thermodesulfovibrionales bacterium]|nr:CRISPR-associated endonuclease Cas2 [Thermodesulfovibrionales bacterium]